MAPYSGPTGVAVPRMLMGLGPAWHVLFTRTVPLSLSGLDNLTRWGNTKGSWGWPTHIQGILRKGALARRIVRLGSAGDLVPAAEIRIELKANVGLWVEALAIPEGGYRVLGGSGGCEKGEDGVRAHFEVMSVDI